MRNFFVCLLLLLPGLTLANAIVDKTHPRDSAICYIKGKRLEIVIRSEQRSNDPNDLGVGEHILYSLGNAFDPLPVARPDSESYRFLKGDDTVCIRVQGFNVGKKLAVLILKENGPYREKLVIQFFDGQNLTPLDFAETEYLTDKVIKWPKGFALLHHPERGELDMGKVQIEGQTFTYQDRTFSTWVSYTENGFEILPSRTFNSLELTPFFKDEKEFLSASGWDPKLKQFANTILYYAVNHTLKKDCVLILNAKRPLGEQEAWRCHQRM